MKCSKCGSTDRLTDHHIYPVCHFGGKHTGIKVKLCVDCHRKIEDNILAVEAHLGNRWFGNRYKLSKSDYERILHNFIRDRTIIYVSVWHWILDNDRMVLDVDSSSSLIPHCSVGEVFYTYPLSPSRRVSHFHSPTEKRDKDERVGEELEDLNICW